MKNNITSATPALRISRNRKQAGSRKPSALCGSIALVAAASLFTVSTASAVDYTWSGGGVGNWDTTDTNWTPFVDGLQNYWGIGVGLANKAIFASAGDDADIVGTIAVGTIQFDASATINGAGNIGFAAGGTGLIINAAAATVSTINANITGFSNNTGNNLTLNGPGKVTLTGVVALQPSGSPNSAAGGVVSVTGGGELVVSSGKLYASAPDKQGNRAGGSIGVGTTGATGGNILRITGANAQAVATLVTVGGGGLNNNTMIVDSPGTAAAPSLDMRGDSSPIRMSSSNNVLRFAGGAFVNLNSNGGSNQWDIGSAVGFDGNELQIADANTFTTKSGGGGLNIGISSNGNRIVVSNGGTLGAGRVVIAQGDADNNYILVTGANSYARQNGGSGTIFTMADSAGASGNSFRVEAGGRTDQQSTNNNRNWGFGNNATATNNYISVTGANSQGNFLNSTDRAFTVGGNTASGGAVTNGGTGNYISVGNGGFLRMDNSDNTLAAAPTHPSVVYGAPSTGSNALVLAGTSSVFNLGDGGALSTAKIGLSGGVSASVFMNDATGRMVFNNGLLISNENTSGNLVSGAVGSSVILTGAGFVSNTGSANNSLSAPLTGAGLFTKQGTGTLRLTGSNSNTQTAVTGGVLQLNGSNTGTVLASGATAILAGNNGTSGAVTVNSDGTIRAGITAAAIDANLATGNLNIGSGSNGTLSSEAIGLVADLVNVVGTVTLGANAILSFNDTLSTLAIGNKICLLSNDGGDAITGTFSNAAAGGTQLTVGGNFYLVSYTSDSSLTGAGNDVVLERVSGFGGGYTYAIFAGTDYPVLGGAGSEALDYDNDGLSNLMEYLLNTDPTVDTNAAITHSLNGSNENQIVFTRPGSTNTDYPSEVGIVYKGQVSSDALTWSDIAIAAPGAGPTETITVTDAGFPTSSNAKRFIRLFVSKP